MKKSIVINWPGPQGAASPVYRFRADKGFFLLGLRTCALTFGGSPTSRTVAVLNGATTLLSATQTTAGTPVSTLTTALGGTTALPPHVDAGSTININLTFSGGTSPTTSNDMIILEIDEDE